MTGNSWKLLLFSSATLLCPLRGEVVDSAANGFTVRTTLHVNAAPSSVYTSLITLVGRWWNSEHTFSHDARNLSIEARPAGCFCEQMPNGGGVRHMEVVYVDPGKSLVMRGGLGPLQSEAVEGSMSIQLSSDQAGTKLVVIYKIGGYIAGGADKWAGPVDNVLGEQFSRLKSFVETGEPAHAAPKNAP